MDDGGKLILCPSLNLSGQPFACAEDLTCSSDTINGVVGCCGPNTAPCNVYTSCVDYAASDLCDEDCKSDPRILNWSVLHVRNLKEVVFGT